MSKAFGAPEQAKIKQIVAEGMTVMQEIQDLTSSQALSRRLSRLHKKIHGIKCSVSLMIWKLLLILAATASVRKTNGICPKNI